MENRRNFIKLRYEQQLKRMCDSYLDWILKGGMLHHALTSIIKAMYHCLMVVLPLRIVFGYGTKLVIVYHVIINGFDICYMLNVCVCCLVITAR